MDGVVLGPSAGAVAATRADAAALCIGVSANANSPLKNAVHDARDVTETLRRAGFAVTLLEDLRSVDALLEALEAFCARLQPGHTALFYFSGFGCQGDDGETYLMPAEEARGGARRAPVCAAVALGLPQRGCRRRTRNARLSVFRAACARRSQVPTDVLMRSKALRRAALQLASPTTAGRNCDARARPWRHAACSMCWSACSARAAG
jgi:hypothetical protein